MNGFPDVDEFRKFRKICEDAGVTDPLLIQLKVGGKEPSAQGKLKLDDESLNPEYKLSWDESERMIIDGFNIGIYGSPDGLFLLDCDLESGKSVIPHDVIEDLIAKANTCTTKTRSGGRHLFFLNDGTWKINPHLFWNGVDAGEVRTNWQYVVCPGSFVPRDKPSQSGKVKGFTDDSDGYYRLINSSSLKVFSPDLFPEGLTVGKKKARENKGTQDHNQKEPKEEHSQFGGALNLSDEEKIKHGQRLFKNEFIRLMAGSSEGFASPSEADYRFCLLLAKMSDSWTEIPPLLVKYRNRPEFDRNRQGKVIGTAQNAWCKNDERLNLKTGRLEPINWEASGEASSGEMKKTDDRDLTEAAIKRGSKIALNRKAALPEDKEELISSIKDYGHYLISADKKIKKEMDLFLKLQTVNIKRADSRLEDEEIDVIVSDIFDNRDDGLGVCIPPNCEGFVNISERGVVNLDYQGIADHLLDTFCVISYVGSDDSEGFGLNSDLYVYDEKTGIYSKDVTALKNEIERIARAVDFKGQIIQATREILHYVAYHNPEREYPFNKGNNLIPVLNGVISIDFESGEIELHDHNPNVPFSYFLPVKFDPEADPGPIDKILSQYVSDDDIGFLYQIPAQSLIQGFCNVKSPYKVSYLIQGLPDAGKSTYHDLLVEWFFSDRFVSKVCLQDLCGGNRFATAMLPDTFLNTYDDLDDIGCLSSTSDFKNLTGSFHHSIEQKHVNRKLAKISCVHLFTCNRPPLLNNKRMETDQAFWERWVYLQFKSSGFKRDPDFQTKHFTPENISGFLNKVLEYVIKIKNDGIIRMDFNDVLDNWSIQSDSIKSFCYDCFYELKAGRPKQYDKKKMLEAYQKYCEIKEIPDTYNIATEKGLAVHIFKEGFKDGKIKNKGPDGKQKHVYESMLDWQGPPEIKNPIYISDTSQTKVT